MLTPAISVVSAVEGLEVGTSAFERWVLPLTVLVLVGLFALQRLGTAVVGALFGPVCLLWFLALGAVGIWNIWLNPGVLAALDPRHALRLRHQPRLRLVRRCWARCCSRSPAPRRSTPTWATSASGRSASRWFALVLPALVLNYFGQGALLIANPGGGRRTRSTSRFPAGRSIRWSALATAATVIASQASITGTYSLTRQAIQLGFLPRLNIVQTSARAYGQIYIPALNWLLLVMVLAAVLGFGSSSDLAQAYGVALTGTMLVTTILTFFVIRYAWRYPLWLCLSATGFFFAHRHRVLLLGDAQGARRRLVPARDRRRRVHGDDHLAARPRGHVRAAERVVGAARAVPEVAVRATRRSACRAPRSSSPPRPTRRRTRCCTTSTTTRCCTSAWCSSRSRSATCPGCRSRSASPCERLGNGCWRVRVRFGFMNRPDVMRALEVCGALGLEFDMMQTSFFLSRQQIVPGAGGASTMARWRERMFAAMARNAGNITDYFNIPTNRVIELGNRVEI